MKRSLSFIFIAVLLGVFSISASAIALGTVIGHTLYTDIVADIDGHPIRSFNVDNHTVVVAEDLRAYGFDVIWHAKERWLEIVRPVKDGEPKTPKVYPDYKPSVPAGKIGTPAHNILYTDIVTTIAGDKVESWNINGETVIPFRELARYGQVLYDNDSRRSMFVTEAYKVFAGGHADEHEQVPVMTWQGKSETTENSMTVTLTVGNDTDDFESFFGNDKTDVNLDLFWTMKTSEQGASVSLVFYPGEFRTQKTLRENLFRTLNRLPIPSTMDNYDLTNSPEVRKAVARVFQVTLNGKPVSGNLFSADGNGHSDFIFRFDNKFTVKAGDIVSITVLSDY